VTGARRPNVFLIGAMKSGTAYLSELLGRHPAVFMSSPREPCYFVDQRVLRRVWPYMWAQGYWKSIDRYLSLFAGAGDAAVVVDGSTTYSKVPMFGGVPERILSFSPDARFIYIMRDPVERTISHYWHRVRWWGEHRTLLSAIRSDPQYKDVGHYARQLNAYLRYVQLGRIYTLTLEALLANPAEQLSSVYAWLGVDPTFRPSSLGIPSNVRPDMFDQVRGYGLLDRFRRTSSYVRVAPYVPRAVRKLGSKFAARSVKPAEVPLAEVRAYLRPYQQCQTEELSKLLNRPFPQWKTLFGTS